MAWIRWRETTRGRRAYVQWRDGTGKVRSEATGTADPRTADMRRQIVEAREEGKQPKVTALTPRQALDRFYVALKAEGRRPATVAYYADRLEALVDAYADVPLESWSRSLLETYLAGQSWAPRTTQMLLAACRRWIGWARDSGVACPDFVGRLKAPRQRHTEPEVLTDEQVTKLLAKARGHHLELPVALAIFAGLSRADLYALDWREVDLKAGMIRRERSKTGAPITVPITDELREVLGRHRSMYRRGRVCRRLPKSRSSLSKSLHRLCDRAGVPPGGWHRFRHTFATRLVARGADLPTIRALLAHRPTSTMALRYLHTDETRMRDAMERAFGN